MGEVNVSRQCGVVRRELGDTLTSFIHGLFVVNLTVGLDMVGMFECAVFLFFSFPLQAAGFSRVVD